MWEWIKSIGVVDCCDGELWVVFFEKRLGSLFGEFFVGMVGVFWLYGLFLVYIWLGGFIVDIVVVGWVEDSGVGGGDDYVGDWGVEVVDGVEEVGGVFDGRVEVVVDGVGEGELIGGCGVDYVGEVVVVEDGIEGVFGGDVGDDGVLDLVGGVEVREGLEELVVFFFWVDGDDNRVVVGC